MIYKAGGKTRVWDTEAHVLIVDKADLDKYLADGWVDHPSKLFDSAEAEAEAEAEADKPKAGRKQKQVDDESKD